jgi:predicted Zn-dependent protease
MAGVHGRPAAAPAHAEIRYALAIGNGTYKNLPALKNPLNDARDFGVDLRLSEIHGEDADEGFVRDRQFIHPKLGFTFTAPEGFTLDNTPQALFGSKRSAGQAFRLDVVRIPAGQSLIEYVNSGWLENIEDGSVAELLVNGIPAVTATAGGEPLRFRLYVMRFGGYVYRLTFASRNLMPGDQEAADRAFREADRSFRESVQTFRPLSESEK